MGKLTKMKIVAFSDPECSDNIGFYDVLFNPKELTRESPSNFDVMLFFDGTGIISKEPVNDQIQKLKNLVYNFNGDIHEPSYLRIYEGTQLLFEGRTKSWNLSHILKDMNGSPLRSELSMSLVSSSNTEEKAQVDKLKSSDLTHIRTAVAGDTLQLMCHRIYGDISYYLGVAKHNGLNDLVHVKPGQKIAFPPLECLEKGPVPSFRRWVPLNIIDNIRYILNTSPGKLIWFPNFGCSIRTYVFDGFDDTSLTMLKDSVYDALWFHESSIEKIKVDIKLNDHGKDSREDVTLYIHISFKVKNTKIKSKVVFPFRNGERIIYPVQSMEIGRFRKPDNSS